MGEPDRLKVASFSGSLELEFLPLLYVYYTINICIYIYM